MLTHNWKENLTSIDVRRDLIIPGNKEETVQYCVEHFLTIASHAIQDHGYFAVALCGGETPKSIFKSIASSKESKKIDWSHVYLFWGDERAVPPDNHESNYRNAMESGFAKLPILEENIFRMPAEKGETADAKAYESIIRSKIPSLAFDLVMLGMGDDGHTASLFPKTHGLHAERSLVIMNYVPQKDTWRMTLTYECINSAQHIAIYVLGKNKSHMIKTVFESPYEPDILPVQRIGTSTNKALWILDEEAASELNVDNLPSM